VRDDAVVAPVLRRDDDGDHLPLELGKLRFAEHQLVVELGETAQLPFVEGVGEEDVRDEPELLATLVEIGRDRAITGSSCGMARPPWM